MLKLLVLSLVVLSIGYSEAKFTRTDYVFEDEPLLKIKEAMRECNERYGSIPNLFSAVREGQIIDSEDFKNILYCSGQLSGYAQEDGHMITEKLSQLYPIEVHDVISKCNQEVGKDAAETTFKFYECFSLNSPCNMGVGDDD